jgi:hypothetical protein
MATVHKKTKVLKYECVNFSEAKKAMRASLCAYDNLWAKNSL